jgi:hypothetical protein
MYRGVGPIGDEPVPGLEVRPVADEATAGDWKRTLVEAYPGPDAAALRTRLLPAGLCAGRAGLAATSTAPPSQRRRAFIGPHHVDVEMISADPRVDAVPRHPRAGRGRSVGRAVTVAATLASAELPAMLVSSDDGRPVYARLGYVPVLRFTMWMGHRQGRAQIA